MSVKVKIRHLVASAAICEPIYPIDMFTVSCGRLDDYLPASPDLIFRKANELSPRKAGR